MKYLILLFIVYCSTAQAQQELNFNVTYNSIKREVNVYFPKDIDTTKKFGAIIGLHGFGMTGKQYRDILKPIADNYGLATFCLDGKGDRHDDDLNGNEILILNELRLHVDQRYDIDSCQVFLTGFSYGGRETMYMGLANIENYAGLIPFSPGIQSAADANNQFAIPWAAPFHFNESEKIPTCICYGLNDIGFKSPIESFIKTLNSNNAMDTVIARSGVGHTLFYPQFLSDFGKCLGFIERNPKSKCAVEPVKTSFSEINSPSEVLSIRSFEHFIVTSKNVEFIEVLSMEGNVLLSKPTTGRIQTELPPGVYVVRAFGSNNRISTQRIALW